MTLFRLLIMLTAVFANPVFAQSGERGSVPPGQSRDGAAPSDGALKGGSILPGETAGIPDKAKMEKLEKRCEELSGTLREDCLKQQGEAASGETRLPGLPSDIRKSSPARAD
jgi:hypothetical protein